jgi:transcriptional regulator with XRE-family HTH domain
MDLQLRCRLASMLIAIRYDKKQTQMKVAKKLNVTHQQIQKYEKGINGLSAEKLIEFCMAYDVPINIFQYGDAYQILDASDISILKKEKAMFLIDKLEEKANDKSRSEKNMVGQSISQGTYI